MLYVITYDIPCDKRRKKVADLLEGYGQRVQYSVFECYLNKRQYCQLQQRLRQKVQLDRDSVRFYPLTAHTLSQTEAWGEPPSFQPPSSTIV